MTSVSLVRTSVLSGSLRNEQNQLRGDIQEFGHGECRPED